MAVLGSGMECIFCWDVAATFVCMSPTCTLESRLIQNDYVCVSHGISTGFSLIGGMTIPYTGSSDQDKYFLYKEMRSEKRGKYWG